MLRSKPILDEKDAISNEDSVETSAAVRSFAKVGYVHAFHRSRAGDHLLCVRVSYEKAASVLQANIFVTKADRLTAKDSSATIDRRF